MEIPLLQSAGWHQLQSDLGEKSELVKEKDYQLLAIFKNTPAGNYTYVPYGPIAESKASFKSAIKHLINISPKDTVFIRIEPRDQAYIDSIKSTHKLKKSTDLNPKETWTIDLTGNEAELKAKLPSRLLRYYKSAEKNGISITTSKDPSDIKYLLALQKSLAKEKGISTFSETYLKTELKQPFATLYLVNYDNRETHQKEIIAAGLVFDDKTTRYNLQGAQNDQGRKLHATGILTIQLILDAYKKGQKIFDFWGIAPENAPKNHPWAGFTNFKKTFTGQEVVYAGTYDIVLNPWKYKLYQIMRKINRVIRKD